MNKMTWKYEPRVEQKTIRHKQEAIRTFYTTCLKASNELGAPGLMEATLKFDQVPPDNVLVASPAVVAMLQSLEQFQPTALPKPEFSKSLLEHVGSIGRFSVFRNPVADRDYATVESNGGKIFIEVENLAAL